MQHNILIIGGGLAGLTCAIHLSKQGLKVTLIEKEDYPHHKVCGEYVSNEVLPYLDWLDASPAVLHPASITHIEFSIASGKVFPAKLPLGGFGISRFAFDLFFYHKALENGCNIIKDQVTEVDYKDDIFSIKTASDRTFSADVVLSAYGKRAALDMKFKRSFIAKPSPWLAVKSHYKGIHPEHVVGLHCFDGGYCGISKVENGDLNVCYLVGYNSFKKYKDIAAHRDAVLARNPILGNFFKEATPVFEKPLTISQISFERKNTIERHMLMIGDTAGLIHPLCGNGMAMAIHGAKIASEAVIAFTKGTINRTEMEKNYTQEWRRTFSQRLKIGRQIASLLEKPYLTRISAVILNIFPGILNKVIQKTHGKPIKVTSHYEYEISEQGS